MMMPSVGRRHRQPRDRVVGESGNVAVEYALTLPMLLGFLYGLMEISHYGYLQVTVANAAKDALRYAIVHSSINATPLVASDITTYVDNQLTGLGLSLTGATVTVTYSPDNKPGSTVQVQISYPFTPFMPGFNAIPGSGTTFTNLVGPITGNAKMILDR